MAGDWIKLRIALPDDPRVGRMAEFMARDRAFMSWLTDPVRVHCSESAFEHVQPLVLRSLVVTGLLRVWGMARERGYRPNTDARCATNANAPPTANDLVLDHCALTDLDEIAHVPVFGQALEHVGWAVETYMDSLSDESEDDAQTLARMRVTFPNYFDEELSPEERFRTSNADRCRRYRQNKQRASTDAQEKRREEKKEPPPTPPGGDEVESSDPLELDKALSGALGAPATDTEWRRRKKTLAQLRKLGATPANVSRRVAAHRRNWPGVTVTEVSLMRHWTACGREPEKRPGDL